MIKSKLLILGLLPTLAIVSCGNKFSYKDNEESYFTSSIPYKENFKILALSDIHFSISDNLEKHANVLRKTVKKSNPDLIVLNGDLFTYAKKSTVEYLFDLMDSIGLDKDIPWTFANGNHDDQGDYNEYYLLESAARHKNALVVNNRGDDVSGRTNYIINLKEGGSIKHQVYIVDSHSYFFNGYFGYEAIQKNQVEWYEHMVNYTSSKEGHLVKSSMFFHIPTLEIKNWVDNKDFDEGTTTSGTLDEKVSAPKADNGFMSKVVELGSTKSVVYGHDHVNDFIFTHGGVQCAYSYTATDRIYYSKDKLGGLLLTIQEDGTSLMEQIAVEY